ncbi:hypothetical protein GCM10010324_21360 [Streptomyces hiroshimensis]|uniref:Uncharacterized protein n=1 Tax=Streptomyces hiroshimensis TaxID=66424 RepID=A0ABQ2Y8P2_9ACTN|nr:hypothetical protein GCM10010324_21360 [Streptomyces hiroshimensis]
MTARDRAGNVRHHHLERPYEEDTLPTSFSRILSESDLEEVRKQYLQALTELEEAEDEEPTDDTPTAERT